jgi:Rrf2 family transcriptional regulator, iron-sulfur cluster assembly transcription factor
MIFSRPVEYSLRALSHLATLEHGSVAMARDVADATEIPPFFLAKILQDLARQGLLISQKGPTGGFRLKDAPEKVTLLRVVEAVQKEPVANGCPAGHSPCTRSTVCGYHESWAPVQERVVEYLKGTTLAQAARALDRRRPKASRNRKRSGKG